MSKKILIVGLILCSFLAASVSTVATDDKTLTDRTGDVTDYYGEIVNSSQNIDIDNIDIVEVMYSKQGQTITLTLEVKGEIMDRGSISDIEADDNIDVAVYALYLYTSEEIYYVFYVNETCQVTNDTQNLSVSDFSAEGSTLAVTFNALNEDETYTDMGASASYSKIPDLSNIDDISESDYEELIDLVPDETSLVAIIDGPSEGKVKENIDFASGVSGGSTPYVYAWDFGDGGISDDENPTHKYDAAGTYDVTLTVTDANYDENSDSLTIIISEDGTSNGSNGNNQEDSNSAILLFAAVILIIVIIGVIVIVFIIRR